MNNLSGQTPQFPISGNTYNPNNPCTNQPITNPYDQTTPVTWPPNIQPNTIPNYQPKSDIGETKMDKIIRMLEEIKTELQEIKRRL